MFRLFRDSAAVSRQTYVDGKSSFSPTGNVYKWYLRTLSPEKQQTSIDKYGNEFSFTTSAWADIREADKLDIGWVPYRVRGVWPYRWVGIAYVRAIVVKE